MGKSANPDGLDAALDYYAASTQMTLCETEPTTFDQANKDKGDADGKVLARVVMAGGDFAKAAGDVSGRKLTVAAKAGLSVAQTGNGDHIALTHLVGDRLEYVTTAAQAKSVTQGETVDIDTWDIEIRDPT